MGEGDRLKPSLIITPAYAYSNFEIENFLITGLENVGFSTDTTNSAILMGAPACGNQAEFDAPKCFLPNGAPMPNENFFEVWGNPINLSPILFNGTAGPDFSRSDVVIRNIDPLIDFEAENVAEVYVNGKPSNTGTSVGRWEVVSEFFNPTEGQTITVSGDYSFLLGAELTDTDLTGNPIAEAEFSFNYEIEGVLSSGETDTLYQGSFNDDVGVAEPGIEEDTDSGTLAAIFPNAGSYTFTAADIATYDQFNIVFDALEEATVRKQTTVPEPTSILGLLAVGGLGLGLKRRKQS